MIAGLVKAFLDALFGSLIATWRANQADKNLEALGYSKATRDAAITQIKAVNAVAAAQQRMAAIPAAHVDDTLDRLRRSEF